MREPPNHKGGSDFEEAAMLPDIFADTRMPWYQVITHQPVTWATDAKSEEATAPDTVSEPADEDEATEALCAQHPAGRHSDD